MNVLAHVKLSSYDPKWIVIFNKEKEKILNRVAEKNLLIEHIGSTAILGAVAKPEVDIMIGLKKLKNASQYIKSLENIGYIYFPKFEKIVPERRYFRKSKGIIPIFHIHMVEITSDFWHDHILFRNYLRKNPKILERYNKLKQDLVLKFSADRQMYSRKKEKFIFEILNIAKYKRTNPTT